MTWLLIAIPLSSVVLPTIEVAHYYSATACHQAVSFHQPGYRDYTLVCIND